MGFSGQNLGDLMPPVVTPRRQTGKVRILPPCTKAVEGLIRKKNLTGII